MSKGKSEEQIASKVDQVWCGQPHSPWDSERDKPVIQRLWGRRVLDPWDDPELWREFMVQVERLALPLIGHLES